MDTLLINPIGKVVRIGWLMWLIAVISLSSASVQAEKADQPEVVTSIYPLALLLNSAWPQLNAQHIVPANQSPHDFALRPSHRRLVDDADFILWLGYELEPYLAKVLKKRHNHLPLLPEADHHDDPHIWLAPNQIPEILSAVQSRLALPAPTEFLTKLEKSLAISQQILAKYKQNGFVVYHDGFTHWVKTFGLNQLAAVTLDPDHPVGSRHLIKVRKVLESDQASCLFVEPQFSSRIVKKLTSGLSVPQVVIDPIGGSYQLPEKNFIDFYAGLTEAFLQCLSQ